jgi:pimeloyl-ACP methyl ester carboxylesterase
VEGSVIDLGSHNTRITDSGEGDQVFLCLHGLVDSIEIWERLTPKLMKFGRVVAMDQRGHGRAGAPPGPYTRKDLAADVIGVLDSLNLEKVILVGHSMGGIIAMTTALAYPNRVVGLVLLGTASHCNEKTANWYEKIALSGEQDGVAGLASAIYGPISKKKIMGDAQGVAHVTRTLKSLYDDPLTQKLSNIQCRTLLIVGEKDPMGPKASANILEALPVEIGTMEVIPECGHWVQVAEANLVADAIGRWLPA